MRLCIHIHRKQYNKALMSYQKAFLILGDRTTNTAVWDTIMWDFSTTLYTKATLLQDYSTAKFKIQSLNKSKATLPMWQTVKKSDHIY